MCSAYLELLGAVDLSLWNTIISDGIRMVIFHKSLPRVHPLAPARPIETLQRLKTSQVARESEKLEPTRSR